LAHPDDPPRALIGIPAAAPVETPSAAPIAPKPYALALGFCAAIVACLAVYLAFAVPGRWFSSASAVDYPASRFSIARGAASLVGNELVVTRAAEDGNTVISVNTDIRAADYPLVAWSASGLPADARVALLWRTDVEPSRVNKRALDVENGQLAPVDVHRDPHWLGRIVGLALAVQGPIEQPLQMRGVTAKPADALDTVRDRVREWMAPEPWTGASINTVAGGSAVQQLPLPFLLAAALALTVLILWALARRSGRAAAPVIVVCAVALALAAWLLLDARWIANLALQTRATAARYAGKDAAEKHLASDDRDLYAFIDKARAVLPAKPARVFVVADADYFRGRAAYHLYPHNVWYDPYRNAVPPADKLRAGDWLVVYQRRGVQYDAARHSLRWEGGATIPVELKLLDHGGALFAVQ
jgi:hypothetical protein